MELGKVFVDEVVVNDGRRPVDMATVDRLAKSFGAIGLQTPITVWVNAEDRPVLVAGRHRLEAARKLKWEFIECVFVEFDERDREIWEVSENLLRKDLTKEQRDKDIRRLAELIDAKERAAKETAVLSRQNDTKAPHRPKGTASKIAEQTGLSKSTVLRALAPEKPQPPARPAINQFESVERQVDALMRAWNSAGPEAREQFLVRIDNPVFDNTAAA
jgi:ParB-like chromosome segregation protein Spo0J